MAAIIITGGQSADDETLQKANQEKIPLLLWPKSAYELAGRLYALGIGNPQSDQT
jgi:predicted transcriptional regulator